MGPTASLPDGPDVAVTVERRRTPRGELVLRRRGRHFEIVSNGTFLMDTRGGGSERLLVRTAVAGLPAPARLLMGGLGVGFSLAEALACPAVASVTVVEIEADVIAWHATHLAAFSAGALDDSRARVVRDDLVPWLRRGRERFDAICLDIDNGPGWTVTDANAALYGDIGIASLARRLHGHGALATWSAAPAPAFEARLRNHFEAVRALTVPTARGAPDVIYLARHPHP